jgi:hypothetical protein
LAHSRNAIALSLLLLKVGGRAWQILSTYNAFPWAASAYGSLQLLSLLLALFRKKGRRAGNVLPAPKVFPWATSSNSSGELSLLFLVISGRTDYILPALETFFGAASAYSSL